MRTLFYGVAGEGRGHAARALALTPALCGRYRVVLYASGQALELLAAVYGPPGEPRIDGVEIRTLPFLGFRYGRDGRLSYTRTGIAGIPYLLALNDHVHALAEAIERDAPGLVITDFEPLLPRAAALAGVPVVSVDHQHFLLACDLAELPASLRFYAALMRPMVRAFCPRPSDLVISSFYRAPLRPDYRHAEQVGVLLRPEVLAARPEVGAHLVAYLRRSTSSAALEALAQSRTEVRVYGLGKRPGGRGLRFCDVHPRRFIEDLATSSGLVTTAGNQLVGEALFLGKPVLAMPEPNNQEQRINAHFLARSGAGMAVEMGDLRSTTIRAFIEQLEGFRARIDRTSHSGNEATLAVLARRLGSARSFDHLSASEESLCEARSRGSEPDVYHGERRALEGGRTWA